MVSQDRLKLLEGRIYTEDLEGGRSVHGEPVIEIEGRKCREWIPWRSKLAAYIKKTGFPDLPGSRVLYLGAAQGTTVSHLSDLLPDGVIYAVEFSRTPFNSLVALSRKRKNIVPLLHDAFHPERYQALVVRADVIYQDISQKEQLAMFLRNSELMLKPGGRGLIMVKARSIDVTAAPETIYHKFSEGLKKNGYNILASIDLAPFQRDHAGILVEKPL